MIHIEKLSLKNVEKYTWQTFVDHFVGNSKSRVHTYEEFNSAQRRDVNIFSEKLSKDLNCQLEDISIGKFYGTKGLDLDQLLVLGSNIENLVVELSPEHFNNVALKSKHKLKLLLENYNVLISDFEECGTLYGPGSPTLVQIIANLNIKPKKLFLAGGCFQMTDYPALNIFKIDFDYWLLATALADNFYSAAIFDKSYKQQLLDILAKEPKNFCVVPILKPRIPRLKLLAYLDKISILEKCDWSCGYNLSIILSYSPKNIQTLSKEETEFLSKYKFPKLFENLDTTWTGLVSPNTVWFNKYKFYVSAETYMGNEYQNEMGQIGFISEKTYRSFLIGSMPIVYGAVGANDYLRSLGFKTACTNINNTNILDVSNILLGKSNNSEYNVRDIQHNFDLITNKQFLVKQVVQPLNKIAELINSIR